MKMCITTFFFLSKMMAQQQSMMVQSYCFPEVKPCNWIIGQLIPSMWLKYIIENLPQYAKMHPHKKQYNIPANSMQHFTKGKNSSIDCVPMQCIDKSHTCLYYHYFKERTEKTGNRKAGMGRSPVHFLCTALSAYPFSMTLVVINQS